MSLDWHVGDTRKVLPTLDAGSVNCVVTSSPYLAKRAYLPADHPDKPLEQGQEATPGEFLAGMLEVTDLLWDVLDPDGVLFWNLGDTASGSGGAGGDYGADGLREGQPTYVGSGKRGGNHRNDKVEMASLGILGTTSGERAKASPRGWPKPKSVCWVPELFGASLAYGRNLLTGAPCRQWITRPPMTWAKPNPSVGAIHDKFRESTELVVMAVKQGRYWFDLDPVRMPSDYDRNHHAQYDPPGQPARKTLKTTHEKGRPPHNFQDYDGRDLPAAIIGSPAQYPHAHYAVMPPWLARLLITVGCPVGGTVLDPYGGSGTTAEAAHDLGRSSISIDLDARNLDLAQDRLGMFPITRHDHRTPA